MATPCAGGENVGGLPSRPSSPGRRRRVRACVTGLGRRRHAVLYEGGLSFCAPMRV